MSEASATAATQHEGTSTRLRGFAIPTLFAVSLEVPKLVHIRQNAQSWLVFRVSLGLAGAALVIVPLNFWNSGIVAVAGLGMFLAAILAPPAKPNTVSEDKARELGAHSVLNGGKYQLGNAGPESVKLFLGAERIWALDSHYQPFLLISTAEIISVNATQTNNRWILQIRWLDSSAEFSYRGVFAEHLAHIAQNALDSAMQSSLPILPRTRAASA